VLAQNLATPDAKAAVALYCATFVAQAACWNLCSRPWCAAACWRPEVTAETVSNVRRAYYVGVLVYAAAAGLAFIRPALGLLLNVSLWVVWIRLGYRDAESSSALAATIVLGCKRSQESADFSAMQSRGAHVMGVDQYTSAHVFEDLPDGGRVVLERDDAADTAAIAAIRGHMREIAASFRAATSRSRSRCMRRPCRHRGDARPARRDQLRAGRSAAGGGSADHESRLRPVDAIHAFLAFQREQHHAAGHEGMKP